MNAAGRRSMRIARYGLLSAAAFLFLAVAADKAFYLYSRSRHASLAARWDLLSHVSPSGSFSQSDIRRIFGSPDVSKGQEWVYRCQDFSKSRQGFPFCEILLTGSADHFMVYEVRFVDMAWRAAYKFGRGNWSG